MSWLAEKLLASQEGLCFMEWFSFMKRNPTYFEKLPVRKESWKCSRCRCLDFQKNVSLNRVWLIIILNFIATTLIINSLNCYFRRKFYWQKPLLLLTSSDFLSHLVSRIYMIVVQYNPRPELSLGFLIQPIIPHVHKSIYDLYEELRLTAHVARM